MSRNDSNHPVPHDHPIPEDPSLGVEPMRLQEIRSLLSGLRRDVAQFQTYVQAMTEDPQSSLASERERVISEAQGDAMALREIGMQRVSELEATQQKLLAMQRVRDELEEIRRQMLQLSEMKENLLSEVSSESNFPQEEQNQDREDLPRRSISSISLNASNLSSSPHDYQCDAAVESDSDSIRSSVLGADYPSSPVQVRLNPAPAHLKSSSDSQRSSNANSVSSDVHKPNFMDYSSLSLMDEEFEEDPSYFAPSKPAFRSTNISNDPSSTRVEFYNSGSNSSGVEDDSASEAAAAYEELEMNRLFAEYQHLCEERDSLRRERDAAIQDLKRVDFADDVEYLDRNSSFPRRAPRMHEFMQDSGDTDTTASLASEEVARPPSEVGNTIFEEDVEDEIVTRGASAGSFDVNDMKLALQFARGLSDPIQKRRFLGTYFDYFRYGENQVSISRSATPTNASLMQDVSERGSTVAWSARVAELLDLDADDGDTDDNSIQISRKKEIENTISMYADAGRSFCRVSLSQANFGLAVLQEIRSVIDPDLQRQVLVSLAHLRERQSPHSRKSPPANKQSHSSVYMSVPSSALDEESESSTSEYVEPNPRNRDGRSPDQLKAKSPSPLKATEDISEDGDDADDTSDLRVDSILLEIRDRLLVAMQYAMDEGFAVRRRRGDPESDKKTPFVVASRHLMMITERVLSYLRSRLPTISNNSEVQIRKILRSLCLGRQSSEGLVDAILENLYDLLAEEVAFFNILHRVSLGYERDLRELVIKQENLLDEIRKVEELKEEDVRSLIARHMMMEEEDAYPETPHQALEKDSSIRSSTPGSNDRSSKTETSRSRATWSSHSPKSEPERWAIRVQHSRPDVFESNGDDDTETGEEIVTPELDAQENEDGDDNEEDVEDLHESARRSLMDNLSDLVQSYAAEMLRTPPGYYRRSPERQPVRRSFATEATGDDSEPGEVDYVPESSDVDRDEDMVVSVYDLPDEPFQFSDHRRT